ncbi:MAG: hypothetical protein MUD12_11460 [Spirochaetes bacterium]|nr:hypothetical protein [Spirochaetota bacterium]
MGARIGGHCWRELWKSEFLSAEDRKLAAGYPDKVPAELGIKCTFCLGDKCLSGSLKQTAIVDASGKIWEVSWIKVNDDIYLHYTIDITERRRLEMEKEEVSDSLRERVKELNCLYSISSIIEIPDIPMGEQLKKIVGVIPSAWRYSDISCAKITVEGEEYASDNYQDTEWKQTSDIMIHGTKAGMVEVCYLEERPEIDEGPFLRHERNLINAIAERLGRFIERTKLGSHVKILEGILPICASCKRIRNPEGNYEQIESFISRHSEALFSHGICPECMKKLYPGI